MSFRRFLSPQAIRLELQTRLEPPGDLPDGFDATSRQNLNRIREGVISELCSLLATSGQVSNENRLFKDLHNREKKAVTAIGLGIAFPHVRTLQVRSFVMAFGRAAEGLPFDAPDEEPVRLFFAMAAPPYDDRTYLKVYKSLSRLLINPENRELFLEATEPSEVLRALELVEE